MTDDELMAEAIKLSLEAVQGDSGGPFGAVIAKGGQIISRGSNAVTFSNDPTAHAEIVAIREACRSLETYNLSGCVIYTSCEPCPMCLGAIYWARLEKIYYANSRQDAAEIGFDDEYIYREIALPLSERELPMTQIMRKEAGRAFQGWLENENRQEY